MPRYEYDCRGCGQFELRQSIHAEPLAACPRCGGTVRRVIHAPMVHYKGSGFKAMDRGNTYERQRALEKVKEGLSQDGGDWRDRARKELPFLPLDANDDA